MCLNGMKLLILYQGCQRSAVILISPWHRHTCAQECACGRSRTGSGPAGRAPITCTPRFCSRCRTSLGFAPISLTSSLGALFCPFHKSSLLKAGSRDPWGSLRHFQGKRDIETMFIIIRCYLSFPLSFCHVCPVEFSRNHVMCDMATDRMQTYRGESGCRGSCKTFRIMPFPLLTFCFRKYSYFSLKGYLF